MRRILLLFIFLFSLLEANEICDFNSEIKNDISELIYQTSELEQSLIGAKEARCSEN